MHIVTGQKVVEQGEEGEAEERGQSEREGIGALRRLHQRLPDDWSEGIGKSAETKDCDGHDAAEGCNLLPPFALLPFLSDAPHSGIGEVRRQARPLSLCEGFAKGIIC